MDSLTRARTLRRYLINQGIPRGRGKLEFTAYEDFVQALWRRSGPRSFTTDHLTKTQPGRASPDPCLDIARGFLKTPYHYGGSNKEGMDCSGLTYRTYESYFGSRMSAGGQFEFLEGQGDEHVAVGNLQPGDLIYFYNRQGEVKHTAIVETVSGKDIGIIAASPSEWNQRVVRQRLGKNGTLGSELSYAGGGRPRCQ